MLAPTGIAPPKHQKIALGMWPQGAGAQEVSTAVWEEFETTLGRKFDTLMMYRNTANASFIDASVVNTQLTAIGASTLLTTITPKANSQGTANTGTLGNLATGILDSTFLKVAAENCISYANPVTIRLAAEFNGNWEAYGYTKETAAEFIEGWKHVVDYFTTAKVTNVKWCWNPFVYKSPVSGGKTDPTEWYPGDGYVDYIGLDGYMGTGFGGQSPKETFVASYGALAASFPGKPFLICEVGVGQDTRYSKIRYFNELFGVVRDEMPQVRGINYWALKPVSTNPDFSLDSSGTNAAALSAFKAAVNAPPMVA
jgi:Glycosyl hydrolase family 26